MLVTIVHFLVVGCVVQLEVAMVEVVEDLKINNGLQRHMDLLRNHSISVNDITRVALFFAL